MLQGKRVACKTSYHFKIEQKKHRHFSISEFSELITMTYISCLHLIEVQRVDSLAPGSIILHYLYKLKLHQKPCIWEFLSLFVMQRDRPDPGPQLCDRQTCLATKVIFLRHVILAYFNPKQSQVWNSQGKCEFFIPYRRPIISNYLCFPFSFICWHPNNVNLPFGSQLGINYAKSLGNELCSSYIIKNFGSHTSIYLFYQHIQGHRLIFSSSFNNISTNLNASLLFQIVNGL